MPPLAKQIVSMPLSGGVDTRTDPLQLRPPKLAELTNMMFVPGGMRKRPGLAKLAEQSYFQTTVLDRLPTLGAVSNARLLLQRGADLCLVADDGHYVFNSVTGLWNRVQVSAGVMSGSQWTGLPMCSTKIGRIFRNAGSTSGQRVQSCDVAYSSDGFYVTGAIDAGGNAVAVAFDQADGSYLGSSYISLNASISARVVSLGAVIIGVAADAANNLGVVSLTKQALGISAQASLRTIVSDLDNVTPAWDLVGVSGGRALLVYNSVTANTLKFGWIDQSGAFTLLGSQATTNPVASVACAVDTNNNIGLVWAMTTANSVVARIYDQTGTALFAAVTVSAAIAAKWASPQQTCVTAVFHQPGMLGMFYDGGGANTYARAIRNSVLTSAGVLEAGSVVLYNNEIISRAFAYGGRPFVCTVHCDTRDSFILGPTSSSAGVYRQTGVVGQIIQNAMGFSTSSSATMGLGVAFPIGVASPSSGLFVLAVPWLQNGAGLDGSALGPPQFWRSLEVNFADPDAHVAVQCGPSAYISGSMMRCYDGLYLLEAGVLSSPFTNVSAASSAAGGSLLPSTKYDYRLFYGLDNANGEEFISNCLGHGAQDALDFSVTTGAADNRVTASAPVVAATLRGTDGFVPQWFLLYRREQQGTEYHLAVRQVMPTMQNVLATIVDTMSEAQLALQPLDPISQGESVPIFPPPHTLIAAGNGRVFIAGLDDPDLIMYSLQREEGVPLQFAIENTIVLPDGDGPITALACIGDVLVVFRSHQAYVLGGTGLDNTAAQGGFQSPRQISDDIGCVEPKSIVQYPNGICFKSSQGFMAMDGQGAVTEIGSNFAKGSIPKIASALSMQTLHQVRWLTASGTYVYDYEFQTWSVWTAAGQDNLLWKGTYLVRPGSTGKVLQEVAGIFADDSVPFSWVLETAWIPIAGIQGRMRLYELLVAGTYVGAHQPSVQFAYDGQRSWVEQRTWNPTSVIGAARAAYGAQPYGTDGFGGNNSADSQDAGSTVYRFGVKPLRQRCSMVKIRMTDGPIAGAVWSGASADLSELALVVGVRPGEVHLPPNRLA